MRSPRGGQTLRRVRRGIERINAWQGQVAVGLHHLPHHVRRSPRVRLWVALKRVIYHHGLEQTLAKRTAA